MRQLLIACLLTISWLETPAFARKMAEQMTCDELVATFEKTGAITKLVHGRPTILRGGIPVRKTQGLQCGPNNYTIDRNSAATIDKRACVYAVVCHGKNDTSKLGYN